MSEKGSRGVIANITQRRAYYMQKSVNDVKKKVSGKSKRKSSEVSLKKYSLPNDSLLQLNSFEKDNCFLMLYRLHAKNQKSVKIKQRLEIRLQKKYNITDTNLRKRLYSEDSPDDFRTVTDIDDGFFLYLNGHPSLQITPQYKSLKCFFHKHLRIKQEVSYRQDCVLNIEATYKKELATYECSIKKYMEQVKEFDAFVSEDYQKSMEYLKNSEQISIKVEEKKIELEYLANRQFIVQSKLIGLDFQYYKQQKYGRFLYYLSPPNWRAIHRDFAHSVEIEAKGFDLGTSSVEETFKAIFEKMQNSLSAGLVKPVLYFSHPDGLIDLFESMEKQQLRHLSYVNHLVPHIKVLKQNIINFKTSFKQECDSVMHIINDFKNYLISCEERKNELEAVFMKILHGLFYDSIASLDFLKLDMHLEFCYEKVYAEKPLNASILWTAKALELKYMVYSFKLEAISNKNVKRAMKQYIEDEKLKFKKGFKAALELRLFDRLELALLRAYGKANAYEGKYDTPFPAKKRSPCRKSEAYVPTTVVAKGNSRELTDAEVEYLAIFTDWTEVENPADYLQGL